MKDSSSAHSDDIFGGLAIATSTFAGASPIFDRATKAQIMAAQEMYSQKSWYKFIEE